MKFIVKGDWEGFFAFGLDALIAFILMNKLCIDFLGYSEQLFLQSNTACLCSGLDRG